MTARKPAAPRVAGVAASLAAASVLAACTAPPDLPLGVRATETVWCADGAGVVDMITWHGHDGELTAIDTKLIELAEGDVSEEALIDRCSRRLRWLATDTLCEAYADAAAVDRDTATDVDDVPGAATAEPPGFPVVIRGDVDCADITLQVGSGAAAGGDESGLPDRLRSWDSTAAFNAWREAEQRFRAAADGACLAVDDARDLALEARAELSGDWPVVESAEDADHAMHAGLCFDVRLHRAGFIEVTYHAVESPGGRSGGVDGGDDVAEDVAEDADTPS